MQYYDISPLISEEMAVFPGDKEFSRKVVMDTKSGDHLTLSEITTTVHIGAHADATNHFHVEGEGIEKRPLETYMGACQVMHVEVEPGARIYPKDLKGKVEAERVLLYTNSYPDPNQWTEKFNSLSPELVEFLAEKKVKLVGIDTPSVDPHDSKGLESHQALWRHNVAVLEGITLVDVPEGLYTLMALPLNIKDADASPVRAVLIQSF